MAVHAGWAGPSVAWLCLSFGYTHQPTPLVAKSWVLGVAVLQAALTAEQAQQQRDSKLLEIGNIVHDSVPVHRDEVRAGAAASAASCRAMPP
jgi:hypothetical protein